LEGLLVVVGLEVTTKGIRTGTGTERWREFQILGAATLKLREPNDVRTNRAERRLVLEGRAFQFAIRIDSIRYANRFV